MFQFQSSALNKSVINWAVEGKRSEVMTWTSPKRFGNSSGPTAPLPGCEFLWSVSPPSCKKKNTRRYNERVMIPCAWLPSLLGAVTHDQARHHPKKGRVCFGFFFKLPPGGGCSGCDLLVTCIRCSRGRCFRLFVTFRCDDDSSDVKWTTVQVRNVQLLLVRWTVVSAQFDAGNAS